MKERILVDIFGFIQWQHGGFQPLSLQMYLNTSQCQRQFMLKINPLILSYICIEENVVNLGPKTAVSKYLMRFYFSRLRFTKLYLHSFLFQYNFIMEVASQRQKIAEFWACLIGILVYSYRTRHLELSYSQHFSQVQSFQLWLISPLMSKMISVWNVKFHEFFCNFLF